MLDEADEDIKCYLSEIEEVDEVYEGDYSPDSMEIAWNGGYYVKSHLLFDVVRRSRAMLMPGPYFEFICEPSNVSESADLLSSEVATSILGYTFNKKSGARKIGECIDGMLLHNRAFARVGFRKNAGGLVEASGEDKQDGQAYFETIEPKDIRIAKGFMTIEDAWAAGGWVARRFYPHVEWVKKNKQYKNNRDIKPDVQYKGQDVDSEGQKKEEQNYSDDLKYCALWEIFKAPTPMKPDGQYYIYSKQQNKILYEADGMPFEGIDFPIRELVYFQPRDKYWATPMARRSINPLLEYEWFESQKLKLARESKEIILTEDGAADTVNSYMNKASSLIVAGTGSFKPTDAMHLSIQNDTTAVENGSMNARARFEKMWGFSSAAARMQGGKIATEMVIENKVFMAEINDLMVRVHHFIEAIAIDLMTINKQMMSPKEQVRITRDMRNVWTDNDEATLEGNYSVTIKSKPLYDMTDGERGSIVQMIMTTMAQMKQLPDLYSRLHPEVMLKQWVEDYGFSTVGLISDEPPLATQAGEISLMSLQIPVPVDPDDDDMEHLQVIEEYFQIIQNSGDEVVFVPEVIELIQQHAQMHQQQLQVKQGGAAGVNQQLNGENNARSAGSESVGGGAVGGQLQSMAQGGR